MWEIFKSNERRARESETLEEFDKWLTGKMPYDFMPSCLSCLTQHSLPGPCFNPGHADFRKIAVEAGFAEFERRARCMPITTEESLELGEFLLKHRGEALALRNLYAHLYDSRDGAVEYGPLSSLTPERMFRLREASSEEER